MIRSFVALLALAVASTASAAEYKIIIKDHLFVPATLEVPAGQKIDLIIENQDATPEEFESHSLKREKIIAGGATARIKVGPLKAGEYKFFGEFNEKTAQGKLVVK
jgi:plastocyanin